MNQPRTILCFGDSNTFGTNPDHPMRHPRDTRWPGRLQLLLGPGFHVVEEGMGGRTTVWDDPLEPNRCGLAFLPVALQSHRPLDLVILSLGTNDCKTHLNAAPRLAAQGAECLIRAVRAFDFGPGYPTPQILLLSPIHIGSDFSRCPFPSFDLTSHEKSLALAPLFAQVAQRNGCLFLDAARWAQPGSDQLHMDAQNHLALAQAVAAVVRSAFPGE